MGSRRYKHRRLTAEEFRARCEATGLGGATLARLCDSSLDRVQDWERGKEDVPHLVALILAAAEAYPSVKAILWAEEERLFEGLTDSALRRIERHQAKRREV